MTKEEKQLLLKDLCTRLPYGVVINYNGLARPLFGIEPTQHFQITLDNALDGEHNGLVYVSLDVDGEEPKPYLRPMSSMTEEEKVQLSQYACIGEDMSGEFIDEVQRKDCAAYIDWLNKNHFDYRGLIERGLAIAVTEENNPYEN
jgi:hypothetical protein